MIFFSFARIFCLSFVLGMCSSPFLMVYAEASSTVTPFTLGGKKVEEAPVPESTQKAAQPLFVQEGEGKQQATKPPTVPQEATKTPPQPLFVKEGAAKTQEAQKPTSKVVDGSTITSFAIPMAPAPKQPGKAVLSSTTQDALSLTSFTPDQQQDTCLRAIALHTSPLVAVRLESMGGKMASWKTKEVKIAAQGVLGIWQGETAVNAQDAAFSLDVSKPTTLQLCVQDSGALTDVQTKFRIIFYHADGTRTYALVMR